jgi:hypothetical protein
MSSSSPGGRGISFSVGAGPRRPEPPRAAGGVLHVLVAADCSGRAARGLREPLANRRHQKVNVDRWDEVVASWRARVETPLRSAAGQPIWLEPRSLDDLHPDRWLAEIPALAELGGALKALATDAGAAAKLDALLGSAAQTGPAAAVSAAMPGVATSASAATAPAAASTAGTESGADTLARLLGGSSPGAGVSPAPAPQRAPGSVDIDRFIRSIIGAPEPSKPVAVQTGALAAAAEAELGRRLRLVLGTPALRALTVPTKSSSSSRSWTPRSMSSQRTWQASLRAWIARPRRSCSWTIASRTTRRRCAHWLAGSRCVEAKTWS